MQQEREGRTIKGLAWLKPVQVPCRAAYRFLLLVELTVVPGHRGYIYVQFIVNNSHSINFIYRKRMQNCKLKWRILNHQLRSFTLLIDLDWTIIGYPGNPPNFIIKGKLRYFLYTEAYMFFTSKCAKKLYFKNIYWVQTLQL